LDFGQLEIAVETPNSKKISLWLKDSAFQHRLNARRDNINANGKIHPQSLLRPSACSDDSLLV